MSQINDQKTREREIRKALFEYYSIVFAIAKTKTKDDDAAKEITDKIIIEIRDDFENFSLHPNRMGLVTLETNHRSIDFFRKKNSAIKRAIKAGCSIISVGDASDLERLASNDEFDSVHMEDEIEEKRRKNMEQISDIREYVGSLKSSYQEVYFSHIEEGLTYTEMEELNPAKTKDHFKTDAHRLRQKIKNRFGKNKE